MDRKKIQQIFQNIPDNLKKPKKAYFYGTAGYRSEATQDLLQCICRASMLALVRSSTFAGKYIGLVITASHNPSNDNGLKMVDHNGECVEEVWEKYFDEVVNCKDTLLYATLNKIHRKYGQMKDFGDGLQPKILIGRDTRKSGEKIAEAVIEQMRSLGGDVCDYGLTSTPQLHWLVRNSNFAGERLCKGEYAKHVSEGFKKLLELSEKDALKAMPRRKVDTANGIVKFVIKETEGLEVELLNGEGELNYSCGADYVKSRQRPPPGMSLNELIVSFDGDADRILYFHGDPFKLIDGDKLCCLIVSMLLKILGGLKEEFKIGAVISVYSNSAALRWLERVVSVSVSNTGVKNFVRMAKNYDLGVYFEPNGHGSCYFSPKIKRYIRENDTLECKRLLALEEMFDPCIGDALTNFIILETMCDFDTDLYEVFPTRDITIKVKDKNLLVVDNKNEVVEPEILKNKLNYLLKKFKGKGFVRPSGTESCIRVHAEARKQSVADELCVNIGQAVYEICGGIGSHPEVSYVD